MADVSIFLAPSLAAGTYLVFGIDFTVMRWLRSRGQSSSASPAATLKDEGSEQDEKHSSDLGHCHGPSRLVETDYASPQAHFDVLILEAGIIFHSVRRPSPARPAHRLPSL